VSYTLSIGCGGGMPLEAAIMLQQIDGPSSYERLIEYFLDTRAAHTRDDHDVRFDDILGVASDEDFIAGFHQQYPEAYVERIADELEPPLVAIEPSRRAAELAGDVSRDLTLGVEVYQAVLSSGVVGRSLLPLVARHGRPSVIVGSYSFFVANQAFDACAGDGGAQARSEHAKTRCLLGLLDAEPHVMSFIEHPSEIIWAARAWAPGELPEGEPEDVPVEDLAENLPRYEATYTNWYTTLAHRPASTSIHYDPAASRSAALIDIRLT
jgi:hypothetical protein